MDALDRFDLTITTSKSKINWKQLSTLYDKAGFSYKPSERIKLMFSNSQYCYFILNNSEEIMGAVRAFSDEIECAIIADMVIDPKLQRKGVGTYILERLLDDLTHYKRIMLFATIGKEEFYKRKGFRIMTSAMCIFDNEEAYLKAGYII